MTSCFGKGHNYGMGNPHPPPTNFGNDCSGSHREACGKKQRVLERMEPGAAAVDIPLSNPDKQTSR